TVVPAAARAARSARGGRRAGRAAARAVDGHEPRFRDRHRGRRDDGPRRHVDLRPPHAAAGGLAVMRVPVRVTPRASKNEIGGMQDGRLTIRVTAPPVDDAANEAVIELLSRQYGVPKRAIRIVSGMSSRNKVVEITGRG